MLIFNLLNSSYLLLELLGLLYHVLTFDWSQFQLASDLLHYVEVQYFIKSYQL